jgi:hypothetical protein
MIQIWLHNNFGIILYMNLQFYLKYRWKNNPSQAILDLWGKKIYKVVTGNMKHVI